MNISKMNPDDPRLTAYALGELEPEEMAAVEAAIKDDPAAQAAVAQIKALGGDLETAFAKEPLPFVVSPKVAADPRQGREAYEPRKFLRFPFYLLGGLAAASVAVMFVVQEREVTRHDLQVEELKAEAVHQRKLAEEASKLADANRGIYEIDLKNDDEGGHVVNMPAAAPKQTMVASNEDKKTVLAARSAASLRRESEAVPAKVASSGVPREPEPAAPESADASARNDVIVLAPFSVTADKDVGYVAANTLAGSRVMTRQAKDLASSITVAPGSVPAFGRTTFNTEGYSYQEENDYLTVTNSPLSTFSIDVDTASYANVRRFLVQGQRPPRDAVRIEEMVNYFAYEYETPKDEKPFATSMEVASAPWNPQHRLVRIGLKGREVPESERPAMNLVFLLDVSGSMNEPNKLPLVKQSMRLLVERLKPCDRVAIVTYAGASGLALPSTPGSQKKDILEALDALQPGGSTNGAMGIQLAYDIAKANFIKDGANRVVLCTDGDFNVGVTSQGDLIRLIGDKAKSGVFLSVLGFGMGNYKDDMLQKLADKGNGNYGYVDNDAEAKKLLVEQLSGTLVTIAKDVKVQVEFNPALVKSYRLIGYEKRLLQTADFNNDKIDAGEIGAGHTVTALYEIVPVGEESSGDAPAVDALKYQPVKQAGAAKTEVAASGEMLTLKIRYKEPTGEESRKLEFPLVDTGRKFSEASQDFKFAASVAGFGMVLRDSPHKGTASFDSVLDWAEAGLGKDAGGHRHEFLDLVKKAKDING